MAERITVAEAVGRTLAQLGVGYAFGVVGSGNFHMTNALIAGGVRYAAARHEMGASCMADAYSRATGDVTIVSLHQGCGLTNALTGLGEAAKAHSPVIALTGDTPGGQTTSNFHIDQDAAVAAVGAYPARVHSAATAIDDTVRAYAAALDRRTVVLSVPIDLQLEYTEWRPDRLIHPAPRTPPGPAPDAVERLLALFAGAERPIILGGRGAWHARAELERLAELTGSLLVTSAAGRGLFVGNEWALDICGGFATDGAAELIEGADLVVAFGASLNRWTTRGGHLLRGATVVQVDDRVEALGWHHPIDLGVLGDTALVAAAAADALAAGNIRTGYRTDDIAERIRAVRYWSDQPVDDRSDDDRIDPRVLSVELDRMLPDERIIVPDGGNFNGYPGAFLRVPDTKGYSVPLAFQSIGLGLSSAIGAAVAVPGRVPVVGVGDGGFMMTHVELDTAVRLGIGLLVVIYDDNAYGAEVHHFEHETDHLETVTFPETDLAALARGYGCEAITVRRVADLEPLRAWLEGPRTRPFVIDAKIVRFASWVLAHSFEGEV